VVLADLALEVEGAIAAVMRLCRSFDLAATDPKEARRARILTPAIKYWICKIAPGFVYEAMECLGGNGYVEDHGLARLYREAPVNAIWEGSGNVMALDLLRAMSNADDAHALVGELLDEVRDFPGRAERKATIESVPAKAELETRAREFAEIIAKLAAIAALQQTAPQIAEIFLQSRFAGDRMRLYGSGRPHEVSSRLLERASPE
jgi:putative acyl-CoA dehydrogenase